MLSNISQQSLVIIQYIAFSFASLLGLHPFPSGKAYLSCADSVFLSLLEALSSFKSKN